MKCGRHNMFVEFLFLFWCVFVASAGGNDVCEHSVNISDGVRSGVNITKNGFIYTPDNYYEDEFGIWGCDCNVKKCVRKCCKKGETLDLAASSITCIPSNKSDISSSVGPFNIINVPPNKVCSDESTRIQLSSEIHQWKILDDGVLKWDSSTFSYQNFCIAKVDDDLVAVACLIDPDDAPNQMLYSIGMIISMPFLLATLLVYALLPERNLHQKALMFYVLTLLVGYIGLVTIQLTSALSDTLCKAMGFFITFCFLVSFFWMNVICLDIWFTFRGPKGFIGSRKDSERRRFLLYCAYAWIVPVLFILVVFLINYYGDLKSDYHPKIGEGKCFLADGLPTLLYFYGPMAILITTNITLFVLTALKIRQVKKETSMLKQSDSQRHTYDKNKQKFNLYVKLMLAMGVNWSMEVISWAVNWKTGNQAPPEIWYITDFCNALYGVFIFFIFVFKKKIWLLLKKRYYTFIGKPHLAHSLTTTTQATRTSQFSSSVTETATTGNSVRNRSEEVALNRR